MVLLIVKYLHKFADRNEWSVKNVYLDIIEEISFVIHIWVTGVYMKIKEFCMTDKFLVENIEIEKIKL